MSKSVLVIMDPIDSIKVEKDTTFQILLSAQEINYKLYYLKPESLYIEKNQTKGFSQSLKVFDNNTNWFELSSEKDCELGAFDYILMRKDPPVDVNYINITYLLDNIKNNKTKIINNSSSLRNVNEKTSILDFPNYITETIVTSKKDSIKFFLDKHKKIILKPLNLMGGESVYLLEQNKDNVEGIIDKITNYEKNTIMVQKFLPEIKNGDKRILIINGKPIAEAIIRVPGKNNYIANIAAGGKAEKYIANKRDLEIAEKVSSYLVNKDIFFAGIDIIGDYLTEINITSPTCMREINYFHNLDLGRKFWMEMK